MILFLSLPRSWQAADRWTSRSLCLLRLVCHCVFFTFGLSYFLFLHLSNIFSLFLFILPIFYFLSLIFLSLYLFSPYLFLILSFFFISFSSNLFYLISFILSFSSYLFSLYPAIGLPLSYFLAFPCNLGVIGLCIGTTVGTFVHMLLYLLIVARTNWSKESHKVQYALKKEAFRRKFPTVTYAEDR